MYLADALHKAFTGGKITNCSWRYIVNPSIEWDFKRQEFIDFTGNSVDILKVSNLDTEIAYSHLNQWDAYREDEKESLYESRSECPFKPHSFGWALHSLLTKRGYAKSMQTLSGSSISIDDRSHSFSTFVTVQIVALDLPFLRYMEDSTFSKKVFGFQQHINDDMYIRANFDYIKHLCIDFEDVIMHGIQSKAREAGWLNKIDSLHDNWLIVRR